MRINFDMDGTIADFYNVPNWLDYLEDKNPYPYTAAKPLLHLSTLARKLNALQARGVELGVISWLSKTSSPEFDAAVTKAKMWWLKKHLPSVKWDSIVIVAYGTPKENYCLSSDDILFDDEKHNRDNWTGIAHNVHSIIEILKQKEMELIQNAEN